MGEEEVRCGDWRGLCCIVCFFLQDFGKLKDLLEERGESVKRIRLRLASLYKNRFSLSPESGELTADDSRCG